MEGDPEVKSKLQQMQRQLLSQNLRKAVSESDVVVTNPTHFAVALKYDTDFYVGRKIWNKDIYNKLCEIKNVDKNEEYFPAYRK